MELDLHGFYYHSEKVIQIQGQTENYAVDMGQIKIRKLIEVNVLYGLSTELSQSFSHQLVVSGWVLWHPVLQYSYSNAGIECLEVLKIIHIWRYSKLKWASPRATFLCLVLINLPRSIQDFLKYFQPLLLPCCRRQSQRAQGSRGAAASRTDRLWIVGSWNTLNWTGTAKIIKHNSWLPKNSNHNSDSIAPALLEFQQAWCHQYFFGEPVPEPDPSMMQLQAIPSGPTSREQRSVPAPPLTRELQDTMRPPLSLLFHTPKLNDISCSSRHIL